MKRIGIISLTRQNSLAYSALKRMVENLGHLPICGESIGAESLFFALEELTLAGYDFLGDFLKRAGLSEADIILISAPYSVNLFFLHKVIWCLRSIGTAPILLGGNEPSNNYSNIMQYRFVAFAHKVVDVSPDFVVRGAAEQVLGPLLHLLDRSTMTRTWDREFLSKLLDIPNIVFWLPGRNALFSTQFLPGKLPEKEIFSYVKYGEKSIAMTLQRACAWARQSRGGCLFCAIATQFGNAFHCAVQSDCFTAELGDYLKRHPEIECVDIWDDTFNIDEDWVIRICGYLKKMNKGLGKEPAYSCFMRPKMLAEGVARKMAEAGIRAAFVGADALTEDLSKRFRRGCAVSELNPFLETLARAKIQPNLSVQLFTPESSLDDVGMTSTVALSCIRDGRSNVHVHLYTFPLFGSDVYRLLEARDNLKKISAPILKVEKGGNFVPYFMAYDYLSYDPDVEEIKQKTYGLLEIPISFHVKTYPSDHIDGHRLKAVLDQVRAWCMERKKTHEAKSLWGMIILLLEDQGAGLNAEEILDHLSKGESPSRIPGHLRPAYDNFGYRYTLSRSLDEVMANLIRNQWVLKDDRRKHRLAPEGKKEVQRILAQRGENPLQIAAYGKIDKLRLFRVLEHPM